MLQIGSSSIALWTIFICAFTFHWIQFSNNNPATGIFTEPGRIFEIIALIICYGVPIIFALTGFLIRGKQPYYNPSGDWCWIDPEYNIFRLCFLYVWVFLAMGLLILFYGLLIWKVRVITDPRYKRVIYAMYGYPLVFFIIFAPLSVVRMWEFVTPNVPHWLLEGASVLWALSGFGNFIVYGVTRGVFFTAKVQINSSFL